ncbi:MAG: dipeptidase, partial [Mariniphaga sp.]
MLLQFVPAAIATNKVTQKEVMDIHNKALTVDTHVDTPMAMVDQGLDMGKKHHPPGSRVDFVRMQEGGLDAIFFAAFTAQRERTPENTQEAYRMAHQMIDSTYAACERYPGMARIALSSADAAACKEQGIKAIYIGMENGFPLGTDLKRVKEFYHRGVRYITLSHSKNNDICDSSSDAKGPEHNG